MDNEEPVQGYGYVVATSNASALGYGAIARHDGEFAFAFCGRAVNIWSDQPEDAAKLLMEYLSSESFREAAAALGVHVEVNAYDPGEVGS